MNKVDIKNLIADMTVEEIEEYLEHWNVCITTNTINMIDSLVQEVFEEGYKEGWERGYIDGGETLEWSLQTERKRE